MRNDIGDIKALIRSRFKHFDVELTDEDLEKLTEKYANSNLNLLYIKDAVDEMLLKKRKENGYFESEEIGDYLSFLQLKQLEIDDADLFLRKISKEYAKKNGIDYEELEKAYKKENNVGFSSEEIGDFLAYLQLKQIDINNAELALDYFTKKDKK